MARFWCRSCLIKITNTSLDKGEELDALVKLPEPAGITSSIVPPAGEKVSAKAEVEKLPGGSRSIM